MNYSEDFEKKQLKYEKQIQLSKEFVREWLIENNFMGKAGQIIPTLSVDFIDTISNRYIHLYELITGEKFIKENISEIKLQNILTNTAISLNSRHKL